jgi:GNAT superfamily N-acetyltransferase
LTGVETDPTIDRFGICEEFRGLGYGTIILKAILSHYTRLSATAIHIGWLPFGRGEAMHVCRASTYLIRRLGFYPTEMEKHDLGKILSRRLTDWDPTIIFYPYLTEAFLSAV